MKRVSIGLLFSKNRGKIALLKREFPEFENKMLLTGIGGNAEEGEGFYGAMVREFKEEAGLEFTEWVHFCSIYKKDCHVDFFKGFSDDVFRTYTAEDDEVRVYDVSHINLYDVYPNLKWLIPLALDKNTLLTIVNC